MSVYEKLHNRWYDKGKRRALQNERYLELDNLLRTEHGTYRWEPDSPLWKERHAIFDKLTPRPLYLRVARFIEHKHLTRRHFTARYKHLRQRAERGWSYRDVWSLFDYLNDVIIGTVTHLRATEHGYPASLHGEGEPSDTDTGSEAWKAVLTKIIEGFEAAKVLGNDFPEPDERAALEAKFDEGFKLFHAWYFDLWD